MITDSSRSDRRGALRKACSFDVQIQPTSAQPAHGIGLEISSAGIVFIAAQRPQASAVEVLATIRGHAVALKCSIVRSDPMNYQGKTWEKIACEVIDAPHPKWDAIVDGTPGGVRGTVSAPSAPVAARPRASEGHEISLGMLPARVQQRIIQSLIDSRRLTKPKPGHAPLVRLMLALEFRNPSGQAMRRFRVHSKTLYNHQAKTYETIFLVSDRGEVTLER